jgi:hypothetical protein
MRSGAKEKLSRVLLRLIGISNFDINLGRADFGGISVLAWRGATLGRNFDINIWKAAVLVNNSVRTAKKTLHFTITKINWFREIIAVYSEKHTKHINTKCRETDC